MPSYNYARYIGASLESVLAQTFTDFEVLVVDDDSRDGSREVVRSYLGDPRVRLIEQSRNQGIALTQNAGISLSSGEFICILNADDIWRPEKLARQVAFLDDNPEISSVFNIPELIDGEGARIGENDERWTKTFEVENRSPAQWIRRLLEKGNCLFHPSAMIRRAAHESVGLYDPRFSCAHDFDLWIRMLLAGQSFHVLAERDTCFRMHGENDSWRNPRDRMNIESCQVFRRIGDLRDEAFFYEIFPECRAMGRWDAEMAPYYFGVFLIEHLNRKIFANILAADLLWTFLSAPERVELATELAGFNWPAFHALMARMNVRPAKKKSLITAVAKKSKALLTERIGVAW
jgi:glycosyltransferase involved in cell wall biosynthesis